MGTWRKVGLVHEPALLRPVVELAARGLREETLPIHAWDDGWEIGPVGRLA